MSRKQYNKPTRTDLSARNRLALYRRCEEAIEFLIDCDGHTVLSKEEFAVAMAARYGRMWLKPNGTGDRRLVEAVANMTRDQEMPGNEMVRQFCGGYVVAYAPNLGGMTLLDPSGELSLVHQLHMLSGDLQRQQSIKTMNRRRLSYWRAAADNAFKTGDAGLARLLNQIENQIDTSGLVTDSLVAEYMKALASRGVAA